MQSIKKCYHNIDALDIVFPDKVFSKNRTYALKKKLEPSFFYPSFYL